MIDLDGTEEMTDVADELVEAIDNEAEVVELITELYFLLKTPERVQVKRNLG